MRQNPYSQVDSEGYLINPNDGSNIWYHVTDDPDVQFIANDDFILSWFAGSPHVYWDTSDLFGKKYIASVRIKPAPGCAIFDPRELFQSMPHGMADTLMDELFEIDDCEYMEDVINDAADQISKPTLEYFESLLDRPEFSQVNDVSDVMGIWALEWRAVQDYLMRHIEDLGYPITGWFEVERKGAKYINLGLYMGTAHAMRGRLDPRCIGAQIEVVNVKPYSA